MKTRAIQLKEWFFSPSVTEGQPESGWPSHLRGDSITIDFILLWNAGDILDLEKKAYDEVGFPLTEAARRRHGDLDRRALALRAP